MSDEFTAERPIESGWYEVILEPNEQPDCLWITVTPDCILWGWHENDDPEAINIESRGPVLYKKSEPPSDLEFRLRCV
jgi:hypothetical protein